MTGYLGLDPDAIYGLTPKSIAKRFFNKFTVSMDGCWEWTASTSHGYGILSSKRGKAPFKAYRISYMIFHGPIPKGLVVRHKCDNPSCVNPEHLELGTQKDNAKDASKRGRLNPASILNLRPGHRGYYGAGPKTNKELMNGLT